MLRVVFDTNILISGLLWGGLPAQALDAAINRRVQIIASAALIAELRVTLNRAKFAKRIEAVDKNIEDYVTTFQEMVEIVTPAAIPGTIVRDPKDVMILACAVSGQADGVVTGDQDLLVLGHYQGVPIWTVNQFLAALTRE